MTEQWKDIIGYEGLYQISNKGCIKSLQRTVKNGRGYRIVREKLISIGTNEHGYKIVLLYKNNKQVPFRVHRLVAIHFIENRMGLPEVNHIDGNKANNVVENLEWVSSSKNKKHSYEIGLRKVRVGENGANAKLSENQAREILESTSGVSELAKKYCVSKGCIGGIKGRRTWKHIQI